MHVTDIGHYLQDGRPPVDVTAPAWRFAAYLGAVIEVASVSPGGELVETPLACRRRPGRRPCPGRLLVRRLDVPAEVQWSCPSCQESGLIRGWARTPWDLSPAPPAGSDDEVQVRLDEAGYRLLRSVSILDREAQRVIAGARLVDGDVLIAAPVDELEQLAGFVAADANHEDDRRRARSLEELLELLESALQP